MGMCKKCGNVVNTNNMYDGLCLDCMPEEKKSEYSKDFNTINPSYQSNNYSDLSTVKIINPKTGEIQSIKIGFSWTLLFFSPFFVPLVLRKLYVWVWVLLVIYLIDLVGFLLAPIQYTIFIAPAILLIRMVVVIMLAFKGNEFTLKNFLEQGWVFLEPNSTVTKYAMQKYGLVNISMVNNSENFSNIVDTNSNESQQQNNLNKINNFSSSDYANYNNSNKNLWIIIGVIVALFVGILLFSQMNNNVENTSEYNQNEKSEYSIGEMINGDNLSFTIDKVNIRDSIGEFFVSNPAGNGKFVTVEYHYQNISNSPISSFEKPTIKMITAENTEYSSDAGASMSFATELNLNEKIVSNLNPGITVNGADVFEISLNDLNTKSFYILVKFEGKNIKIKLDNLQQISSNTTVVPAVDAETGNNTNELQDRIINQIQSSANISSSYNDLKSESFEFKEADDRLNQTYKHLMKQLSADEKIVLKKEQLEWLKMRDKEVTNKSNDGWQSLIETLIYMTNSRSEELESR